MTSQTRKNVGILIITSLNTHTNTHSNVKEGMIELMFKKKTRRKAIISKK